MAFPFLVCPAGTSQSQGLFLALRQWKLETMGVDAVWQYVSKHSVSHKAPNPPLLVFGITFSSQILPSISKLCPSQQACIPQDKLLKTGNPAGINYFYPKKKKSFVQSCLPATWLEIMNSSIVEWNKTHYPKDLHISCHCQEFTKFWVFIPRALGAFINIAFKVHNNS